MKRILFVQHSVAPPGGGAGVGAHMLDVLKSLGSIDLVTMGDFRATEIDEYYRTELVEANIRPVFVRHSLLEWTTKLGIPNGLLRLHVLMREAKKFIAGQAEYDLICSAYDEVDVGSPCIQYIHYPWNLYPRPDAPAGWNERSLTQMIILMYNFVCRKFSGYSNSRMYQNLTLVNSRWTGDKARQKYPELKFLVLYPPALAQKIVDDRARRQPRFLSIGRCSIEKDWLKLIDIVVGLRERGHEVGLTLAGSRDNRDYENLVRERMAQAGDWVEMKTDFTREELQEMLVTHQYGIHGMKEEHYGMAVAELVLGGCLTSVHNDGGQVEIVRNQHLRYSSAEDAIEKWDRILSDPELERILLEEQLSSRDDLTKERFKDEFERVARACLERSVPGVQEALREGLDFSLSSGSTFS